MWSTVADPVRRESGTWHADYRGTRGDVWDIVLRVADGQHSDRTWLAQLRETPDATGAPVAVFTMTAGDAFVDTDGDTKRDLTFRLATEAVLDLHVTYYGDIQFIITAGTVGPYTPFTFTGMADHDVSRS